MRINLVLPLLLVSATIARAQEFSPKYLSCMEHSSTTNGNKQCAGEELTRVQGDLNSKYARVLEATKGTPEAVSKVRAAKAAWEAFVTAYVEALFPLEDKQREYGTSYGESVSIWKIRLAQSQLVLLDGLIAQHVPQK